MAIGKQIRKYRKALGWKLKQLSDASGVDVGTLSALEQRDSKKSDYFLPIAAGLGLTLEQLADEERTHVPSAMTPPTTADGAPSQPATTHTQQAQPAINNVAASLDWLLDQVTNPIDRATLFYKSSAPIIEYLNGIGHSNVEPDHDEIPETPDVSRPPSIKTR